jgi:hypothetical protein
MQFTDSDTLVAEIPIIGSATYLSTIDIPEIGPVAMPPVCLPYSPEFEPVEPYVGASTLARLAKATYGVERVKLGDIWSDVPKRPRLVSMQPWLLILAVVILLVEVFERRTGLIGAIRLKPISAAFNWAGALRKRKPVIHIEDKPQVIPGVTSMPLKIPQAQTAAAKAETKPAENQKEKTPADAGLIDALNRARRSAKSRTDHK